MIKNYLKTAFRGLLKNKGYSFLNIFGLAIGIACAAIIFLWVEGEVTYNDYFSNKAYIYKVKDRQTYNGETYTFDAACGPLAPAMQTQVPGIKYAARASFNTNLLVGLGEKTIYESGTYVDPSFVKIFQLKFLKGNSNNALSQPNNIVVTEKMARAFFNSTNVIGKTMRIDNKRSYAITGVVADMPKNVSIKFEWLIPFSVYLEDNPYLKSWGNNGLITYAEVEPNANITAINKQLHDIVGNNQTGAIAKMSIYPMERWRLYDSYDKNGFEKEGKLKFVKLFTLIAWIVLVIACINFMNLSTARSEKRRREVGVRKVMGAGRWKLIGQFIGESMILSFLSSLLAIIIIALALPSFNELVEKQLTLDIFRPSHIIALLTIIVSCGLIAGSYPAFYLSSFNPISVLKGLNIKTSASAVFIRKGLVILQFATSVVLIICTAIIYRQVQHAKDRDMGYNKDQLVYTGLQGNAAEHYQAIRHDLLGTGKVENMAVSSQSVLQLGSNTGGFSWPGKDASKQLLVSVDNVSPEFISTIGGHVVAGRDFYPDAAADSNNVIINEAFAKAINAKNIIGTQITNGNQKVTVVGVMHDFIYNNMYASPAPVIMFCNPKQTYTMTIRLKAGNDFKANLAAAEDVIKRNNPGYPVEFNYVDKDFENYFKSETLVEKLSGIFAGLAIIISCLGLFGLTAYTAEKRFKEIGIRKVLGASAQRIAALLSREFVILVAVSCVIAFPVAWMIMHAWLKDYEYQTNISWWVFIVTDLFAIAIAVITVSFQAVKAALTNPVKSLRSE